MNKPVITAKMLRKQCKQHKEKEPCFICGKHKTITELHHVLPLSECSKMMNKLNVKTIFIPVVWLCPNCHAYAHAIKNARCYKIVDSVVDGSLSKEEFKRFREIQQLEEEAFVEALGAQTEE